MHPEVFSQQSLRATLAQLRSGTVHDVDFMALPRLVPTSGATIFDIGANRGQSIASVKALLPDAIIHAFEANPLFFDALDALGRLHSATLSIHRYGLAAAHARVLLYVPWVGDVPYLEEASTRLDYFQKPWVAEKFRERGGLRLEETIVELRAGDELGLDPDIIKIDVEGAEHDVLLGLEETIARSRPSLLVENSDWHAVTELLAPLGYLPFRWEAQPGRFVPFHGQTTNSFYFHESRLRDFVAT